ncbi:MAG: TerC family protein [Trueperaceae bacterium]
MEVSPIFWIVFNAFVFAMLALDLGVFNRKAHTPNFREAGTWSAVWIALALLFNLGIYIWMGPQFGTEFLTGYLIEYSLSVDNIFVFVLIFSAFAVPSQYQHRVLFWGVLGALILRAIMIFAGAALIERFHWILYIFGAFLIFVGIRMFRGSSEEGIDLENNRILTLIRRFIPVTDKYHGQKFFILEQGKRMATPLFMVLVLVEFTDLLFALDSIPAIFAVTREPFIVYTSNVFAIMGLRSLYFLLANIVNKFVHLHYGLAVVLTFVGIKLLTESFWHIPNWLSLLVIILSIGTSIVTSLLFGTAAEAEFDKP